MTDTNDYLLRGEIRELRSRLNEALGASAQITCQCGDCYDVLHASSCSVHNEPAYPNGPCDCDPTNSELRPPADTPAPGSGGGEIARLKARVVELEAGLDGALAEWEANLSYKSEFLQDRHEDRQDIAAYRTRLLDPRRSDG